MRANFRRSQPLKTCDFAGVGDGDSSALVATNENDINHGVAIAGAEHPALDIGWLLNFESDFFPDFTPKGVLENRVFLRQVCFNLAADKAECARRVGFFRAANNGQIAPLMPDCAFDVDDEIDF